MSQPVLSCVGCFCCVMGLDLLGIIGRLAVLGNVDISLLWLGGANVLNLLALIVS